MTALCCAVFLQFPVITELLSSLSSMGMLQLRQGFPWTSTPSQTAHGSRLHSAPSMPSAAAGQ